MRDTYISFARLPSKSFFNSRGNTWIKLPCIITDDTVRFNAVHVEFQVIEMAHKCTVDFFPDEILVTYDPEETVAELDY